MFTICFVEALSCSVCLFEEGDISLNNSCPVPASAQRLNDEGVCEILSWSLTNMGACTHTESIYIYIYAA